MSTTERSRAGVVIAQEFKELIQWMNVQVRTNGLGDKGGSTASIIGVLANGELISAHVGDTPIFLYEAVKGARFQRSETYSFVPHDVFNVQQIEALQRAGHDLPLDGRFLHGRDGGMISVTNSIGDTQFDLLCEPTIAKAALRQDSPSVIVVASDGILENGATQITYEADVNACMVGYTLNTALDVVEAIARSILSRPTGQDNCTVLVSIYDPACDYEENFVGGVFDGHFSDEVADFAVTAFRDRFYRRR